MKVLFFVLPLVLLFSCNNPSPLHKKLSATDSLEIVFNVPGTDTVVNQVNTTDAAAIKKIVKLVDGKTADGTPCGFNGHMSFFRENQLLLQVVFAYEKEDCRQFLFDFQGRVQSTRVSNEAKDFLESLAAGRNWY